MLSISYRWTEYKLEIKGSRKHVITVVMRLRFSTIGLGFLVLVVSWASRTQRYENWFWWGWYASSQPSAIGILCEEWLELRSLLDENHDYDTVDEDLTEYQNYAKLLCRNLVHSCSSEGQKKQSKQKKKSKRQNFSCTLSGRAFKVLTWKSP